MGPAWPKIPDSSTVLILSLFTESHNSLTAVLELRPEAGRKTNPIGFF